MKTPQVPVQHISQKALSVQTPLRSQGTIAHIEGLRGLAIIMVVSFHCFSRFKNGFLGVDIFLVISGYLLFRSFWGNYETFDPKPFIIKKIQRIFPLSVAVSIMSCLLALLFFPCNLVLKIAKTAIFAIVGCSNFYLDYTFSDYFASDARLNPLVHTWYLSVILQVYLIYVAIAMACRRKSQVCKVVLLSGIFIVSIFIYYARNWIPELFPLTYVPSSYYWTSGRLWMVVAGALAHFLPARGMCGIKGAVAVLLLLFMGFSTVLSPMGTMSQEILTVLCCCVVLVWGGSTPASYLLSHPLVRCLGKYSFSLYIIHWPVIVFSFYLLEAYLEYLPTFAKLGVLCICSCLTIVIYHFIEKQKLNLIGCLSLGVTGLCIASVLSATNGCKKWIHVSANAIMGKRYADTGKCRAIDRGKLHETLPPFRREFHHAGFGSIPFFCETVPLLYEIGTNPEKADFILIGDSHAEALYPGLDILAEKKGWNGVYLHTYVIPFMNIYSELRPDQKWDARKADLLFSYLEKNQQIKTVFIGNVWAFRLKNNGMDWSGARVDQSARQKYNISCLRAFVERLRQLGKQVVVFTDVPWLPLNEVENYLFRRRICNMPIDEGVLTCTSEAYGTANGQFNEKLKEWEEEGLCKVLHPERVLLQSGSCCCLHDDVLYYMDGHHLTLPGSQICIDSLETDLEEILAPEFPVTNPKGEMQQD